MRSAIYILTMLSFAAAAIQNCDTYTSPSNETCLKCTSGYFRSDSNTKCSRCSTSCKECDIIAERCTSCPENRFINPEKFSCEECAFNCQKCSSLTNCDTCSDKFFREQVSNACLSCSAQCLACIDNTRCVKCEEGYEPSTKDKIVSCAKSTSSIMTIIGALSIVLIAAIVIVIAVYMRDKKEIDAYQEETL